MLLGAIRILDVEGNKLRKFRSGDSIIFVLEYKVIQQIPDLEMHIRFYDADTGLQAGFSKILISSTSVNPGEVQSVSIILENMELRPGTYLPHLAGFSVSDEPYDIVDKVFFDLPVLEVIGNEEYLNSIIRISGSIYK